MKGIYIHILFLFLALFSGIQISDAQNVGIFYNSNYTQIDDGNLFAEGSNLKRALETLPFTSNEFNNFNIGTISSVLGASDMILIPELERGDIFNDMSPESRDFVRQYVANGGGLVICGVVAPNEDNTANAMKFLNGLFDFSLASDHFLLSGTSEMNMDNTLNTQFENLEFTINNNNSTSFITSALPDGATALYSNMDDKSETTIALLPYGKGKIIYLGWGWWNAQPVGSQDGGWMDILEASIKEVACMGPTAIAKSSITVDLANSGFAKVNGEMLNDGSILCSSIGIMDVSPSKFSCENVGTNEVIFTVTDAQGRQSAVKSTVIVTDTKGICAAKIRDLVGNCFTLDGNYIDDVEVSLNDDGEIRKDMTLNGLFSFEALSKDKDYQIFPSKNENVINGISTFDILLIERYILNGEGLTPHAIIAGDVDQSGDINVLDIIQIRKLILGKIDKFDASESWRFFPRDADVIEFADNKGKDVYSVNDWIQNDLIELIGIKMGDVSGDAIANANQTSGRDAQSISNLKMQDVQLEEDEISTIDFFVGDFTEMLGFQLVLDFDVENVEILNVKGGQINLTSGNFNIDRNGKVIISYNTTSALQLSNEPIFSLEVLGKSRIESGTAIKESSHGATSEIYISTDEVTGIEIEIVQENENVEVLETAKVVYQNQPNPFTAYTEISFYTPQDDFVELYIFNAKGEFLFGKKGDFKKGTHTVYVDGEKFSINGVYFYKIVIGKFSQTKRMVKM